MKAVMSKISSFMLGLFLLAHGVWGEETNRAADQSTHSTFDITQLAKEDLPTEVTLKITTEFQMLDNGKPIGSFKIQAGKAVHLMEVKGTNLHVGDATGDATIPYTDTDLVDRVEMLRKQHALQTETKPATNAPATNAPTPAPTPEAETAPEFPEDSIVSQIECTYDGKESFKKFGMDESPKPGTYHYSAYIPPDYNANKTTKYPAIFIMSPGGGANFDNVKDKLKEVKWIGITLSEACNGPWAPIMGNFLAAHDSAIKKFRIQDDMKFSTGFSGGARASSLFLGLRPGFRGAILQAAGFWSSSPGVYGTKTLSNNMFVYMIVGKSDGNFSEIERMRREVPASRFQSKSYDASHQAAPADLMSEAIDWMIQKTIKK